MATKKYSKTASKTSKPFVPYNKAPIPFVSSEKDNTRNWSDFQKAVFNKVESTNDSFVVDAVAGSGKTTTIIEAMKYVQPGLKIGYAVFNKKNKDEAETRVPTGISVSTINSIGLNILYKATPGKGQIFVDGNYEYEIITSLYGDSLSYEQKSELFTAVGLAKMFLCDNEDDLDGLFGIYLGSMFEVITTVQELKKMILEVMATSIKHWQIVRKISFNDQVWLPTKLQLTRNIYDVLFVDECQDMSIARMELMIACAKRIIAVGDPRQAIYEFAGAAPGAFNRVAERINGEILNLSVCYRCARSIVEHAASIVPGIQYHENAEMGIVRSAQQEEMIMKASYGDFILSRYNAPLLSLCFSFIREGRKANIQGKDIGKDLKGIVNKGSKAGAKSVENLLDWLNDWEEGKIKVIMRNKNKMTADKQVERVRDQADCIRVLAESCSNLSDVLASIDNMFIDGNSEDIIMLSTVHKAKGLERDRVWLLTGGLRTDEAQEANIQYVGITRAKKELVFVASKKKK